MGCNCKQVKKIGEKYGMIKTPNYNKGGFFKILGWLKKTLWNILGACLSLVFMIVIMPIIILILFFNTIFKGQQVIDLSFVGKLLRKNKDEVQEIGEN